jgi:hypothetical protein
MMTFAIESCQASDVAIETVTAAMSSHQPKPDL